MYLKIIFASLVMASADAKIVSARAHNEAKGVYSHLSMGKFVSDLNVLNEKASEC